jgi:2-iminobutanoate/2-iminopropanoate deaminase
MKSSPDSPSADRGPRYFPMADTAGAKLPFSEAVQLGDTLYVSGQIGILPGSLALAAGGVGPEARRAIENMKAVLERHGSSLNHVVKCTVYLADILEWPAFNEVYCEYFRLAAPSPRADWRWVPASNSNASRLSRKPNDRVAEPAATANSGLAPLTADRIRPASWKN